MTRNAICLLLGLCLVGFVLAQERSPEAIEILKKVDAAIKAVDSVRYDVQTTPEGIATHFVSPAKGSAVVVGWNGGFPERFYMHVETRKLGTEEHLELTGGGNGETYFIIDHNTKKAYQDLNSDVMGSGGATLLAALMLEFVRDAPFDDELNGETVELQGVETVGDEECYKIHVVYAGGQGGSTWYFSKKDLLPRRHTQHFDLPRGSGSLEIVISNLETNPKASTNLYELKLPAGYEQIDGFHP